MSPEEQNKKIEEKRNSGIIALVIVGIFVAMTVLASGTFALLGFNHHFSNNMMERGEHGMMGRSFGMHDRNSFRGQTIGEVTKISGQDVTIKTSDNQEIAVKVAETTSFYKDEKIAKFSDLATGNKILIYGSPDINGVVQAQAIVIA